ncbi:MAG: AAA family ATPase, partial [Pseudomonadota bacterium]
RYGRRHPEILKVDQELSDLEDEIAQEVQRIVSSLDNEVAISRERVRSLNESLDGLEEETSSDNADMIELRQLQREADAVRAVYESFLARFENTSEASLFEEADARIIGAAQPAASPTWPQSLLLLAAALAVSTTFGVAAAFIREELDSSFKSPDAVEEVLQVALLSSVPLIKDGKLQFWPNLEVKSLAARLGWAARRKALFAESWRSLVGNIYRVMGRSSRGNVVLVTSSLESEGKTFTSLCLAHELATNGHSVVVVDSDVRLANLTSTLSRYPALDELFKEKRENFSGLTDYLGDLEDELSVSDIIVSSGDNTIDLIPCLAKTPNPMKLFLSGKFEVLLNELRERYDYVVVDTAPVIPIADTRLIAPFSDLVLLVVQWSKTPRKAVQKALNLIGDPSGKHVGVVLSQVNLQKLRNGGYSGDSKYGGLYYG